VDIDETDGTNVVFWTRDADSVAGGRVNIESALGVTFYATMDDIVIGSDIVLNADPVKGYNWFTDINYVPAESKTHFIEGVTSHEIGHLVGLEHAPLGATTLFFRGARGVNTQLGLSSDDISGLHVLYPQGGLLETLGQVEGRVTKDGTGVWGAVVVISDSAGGFLSATLTSTNGSYKLRALPPGAYEVRVAPLDDASPPLYAGSPLYLIRGRDIMSPEFVGVDTAFHFSQGASVAVQANRTTTQDLTAASGAPPYRIGNTRGSTTDASRQVRSSAPVILRAGQSNIIVGIYGLSLPTDAQLSITGDGLTVTPVSSTSLFPGLDLVSLRVTVSTNATPGLRSFALTRGQDVAWANGFVDVQPAIIDFNFDGLDDLFQRRYFPLFTASEAGPEADPDGDGYSNRLEYLAGTNPTDQASHPVVRINRLVMTPQGAVLDWNGISGKRYQVLSRSGLSTADRWTPTGPVLTALETNVQHTDPTATNRAGFYCVQVLP
jgi:hypothetical protein